MNILFASQFFWPDTGGVQKVLYEVARRLVWRGHHVTVASSKSRKRTQYTCEGVRIVDFHVTGNQVKGMGPDIEEYRKFLLSYPHDIFMVKAAQQWTFDAALDVLPQMQSKKFHIPCGYSGLFDRKYYNYFKAMPDYLRLFDGLIYYTDQYFDIDFARKHNLQNLHILCNGACEEEFATLDNSFRTRFNIPQDDLLLLSVGAPLSSKGHGDCLEIFTKAKFDRPATLVMVGPYANRNFTLNFSQRLRQYFKKNQFKLQMYNGIKAIEAAPNKRLLLLDLERTDTVAAFKAADLFLFTSHVEYSPLVLFEAAASATPFISNDVGNSREIATQTNCGIISSSASQNGPWKKPNLIDFTEKLELAASDPGKLQQMGKIGRKNWHERFTWDAITTLYEKLFLNSLRQNG